MLTMKHPIWCCLWLRTGVGKTHLALNLLEGEYFNHFDYVVILCTTLRHNTAYRSRKWFWTDPYITLIAPGDRLYDWIEKLGNILAGSKTLFLIDDIIADEILDKKRQPLLGLAISGRQVIHYGC